MELHPWSDVGFSSAPTRGLQMQTSPHSYHIGRCLFHNAWCCRRCDKRTSLQLLPALRRHTWNIKPPQSPLCRQSETHLTMRKQVACRLLASPRPPCVPVSEKLCRPFSLLPSASGEAIASFPYCKQAFTLVTFRLRVLWGFLAN